MAHSECGGRRSLRSSCRTRSTTHPRRGTYMRSIRHTYDRCQHATQHAAVRVATQCASCVPMQRARYKQVAIPNGDAACTDGAQNMTAWELHARNRPFDQTDECCYPKEAGAVRCTRLTAQCDVPVSARRQFRFKPKRLRRSHKHFGRTRRTAVHGYFRYFGYFRYSLRWC
jgi:hypothetical protein